MQHFFVYRHFGTYFLLDADEHQNAQGPARLAYLEYRYMNTTVQADTMQDGLTILQDMVPELKAQHS